MSSNLECRLRRENGLHSVGVVGFVRSRGLEIWHHNNSTEFAPPFSSSTKYQLSIRITSTTGRKGEG